MYKSNLDYTPFFSLHKSFNFKNDKFMIGLKISV